MNTVSEYHDHAGVEQIWNLFNSKLRQFINKLVKDEALADDILQDVFIKIHNQLPQLKDEKKIQAWVYQIARNTVYDHFRKPGSKAAPDEIRDAPAEEEPDQELMAETIEDMIRMMDNLPPDYCDILCKTEIAGMSHKEYADLKGISYTAAKTKAFRARARLREMMMRCCHYQFDQYGTVVGILPAASCCCCSGNEK